MKREREREIEREESEREESEREGEREKKEKERERYVLCPRYGAHSYAQGEKEVGKFWALAVFFTYL